MSARPLAIIAPRLVPQICGVGAYSWQLHRHWPEQREPHHFLVVDGAEDSVRTLAYSHIDQFDANPAKLAAALNRLGPADLLLHYAAHPYRRWTRPFWLPRTLQKWKQTFPAGRLLLFFHELPTQLPISSVHFWTSLWDSRIIRQLARTAHVIVSNTEEHVAQLRQMVNGPDVHFSPVGSNIERVDDLGGPRAGTEFAIFGLPFGRWQTLQIFDEQIRSWQQNGVLTRLHLIGPNQTKFDRFSRQIVAAWPEPHLVVEHGMLPDNAVSALLTRTRFGLTNATSTNWSKSGVFMAYAAHGCAVIAKIKSGSEPLCFTVPPEQVGTISAAEVKTRAQALTTWYQHHADWNVIAQKICDLFPVEKEVEAVP